MTPFIVVGFDPDEQPLCLLPFGLKRVGPLRQVSFLGGRHANYNFGIWDPTVAVSVDDLRLVLQYAAASPQRPDLLALHSQPRTWRGLDNPFLLLPHRQSPSNATRLVIDGPGHDVIEREVGAATRGRLRTKERKLQKLPGYRYFRATQPAEVDRLLDQFFALKASHMAAQGLPNVFTAAGVRAFLRSACHQGLSEGHPAVELHGLEGGGELLALFGVLSDGQDLSVMINTYTLSDNARHSPGLILILHLIQFCADRGITGFDLGVGDAQYKSWFCKQPIALFDSFLPLTALGRLSAIGMDTANVVKREIKNTPALWGAYLSLRRAFGSSSGEPSHS
jgi:CelD/BcsL family acetyltransferase involved in cellulose biosynthesis